MKRLYQWLMLMFLLGACSTIQPDLPTLSPLIATFMPRLSAWGEVHALSQVPQINAPALLPLEHQLIATWTSADDKEARHIMRTASTTGRILALKAYHPMLQSLFAADGKILMLWLDRTPENDNLQVLAGTSSPDAIAEFGANPISHLPALRYSAFPAEDETVRLVWTGQRDYFRALYWQAVDFRARPLSYTEIRQEADYPALLRDNQGIWWLYWLEANGEQAYVGQIVDNTLVNIMPIAQIRLEASDSLESFYAAQDSSQHYLFWNIRDAEGQRRVLWTVGDSDLNFQAPQAFSEAAAWAVPLAGQHERLPVAIQEGESLGMAYFENGTFSAYEDLVQTGVLAGAPSLAQGADGSLYLAWAEVTSAGYANLFWTSNAP